MNANLETIIYVAAGVFLGHAVLDLVKWIIGLI